MTYRRDIAWASMASKAVSPQRKTGESVMRFRIKGKRDKIRFVPLNAAAQRLIEDYLALTGRDIATTSKGLFSGR